MNAAAALSPVRGRRRLGRYLPILCLLAPLLVFMGVFYGAPMLLLADESFRNSPTDEVKRPEPTAHHYARTFESARTFRSLTRTFRLSAIATVIALIVCFPIALLLILGLAGLELRRDADRLSVVYLVDHSDSMPPNARQVALKYVASALQAMGPNDQSAGILFGGAAAAERPRSPSKAAEGFTS